MDVSLKTIYKNTESIDDNIKKLNYLYAFCFGGGRAIIYLTSNKLHLFEYEIPHVFTLSVQ